MTAREIIALLLVVLGFTAAVTGAARIEADLGLAVAGVLVLWVGLRVGDE